MDEERSNLNIKQMLKTMKISRSTYPGGKLPGTDSEGN
jgi:hypothetical protein